MMEAKVERITPETAAKYLKRNVDNYRKISKRKVSLYAAEMKAGKWQNNGEGIMFDETGRLKNGQHRLAAIIMAATPVEMLVIRGVSDNVSIYDSGMVRSMRQIANASGCEDMTSLETAAGTILAGAFERIPKGQTLEYLQGHAEELKRAYTLSGANGKHLSSRTSAVLATVLQLYDGMKAYEVEVFFQIFNSGNVVGTDGYDPSPALVARRMIESAYKMKSVNDRAQREMLEIFTLAMNDFRQGKSRQMNYQIKEPMKGMELLKRKRAADGLK